MSGLSMGWNLLSKGAATAAVAAKDFTAQAGVKAAELGGTVTDKVNEGGLFGGLSSIASKATDGFSSFVKSPSLQGFTGAFKPTGNQYEDLGSPAQRNPSGASLSSQYKGDFDSYNSTGGNSLSTDPEKVRKKSPTPKKPRSKNNSEDESQRKPKKKSPSPQPPSEAPEQSDLMFFDAPKTRAAKQKQEQKKAEEKKAPVDDDADAWALLNS